MFGTHNKDNWGARNVWYSQSNPSAFGSGFDLDEPPSPRGILGLPLISCKINHDFDCDNHKLGYGIENGIYQIYIFNIHILNPQYPVRNHHHDILKQKVAET